MTTSKINQHISRVCKLYLLFALWSITAYSQEPYEVPDVIPPSPNSAGLGKYGDVPTDLHHGTPNISIPLYEIIVDDIRVPISLSFHASGHKVGEQASWVGLGWSLNAGGVIGRSMRGKPDEDGYFYNMQEAMDWHDNGHLHHLWDVYVREYYPASLSIQLQTKAYDYLNGTLSHSSYIAYLDNVEASINEPELPQEHFDMKDWMHQVHTRNLDTQADIFNFNFPGNSGKFMFKPDGSIIQIPHQDIQIEVNSMSPSTPCQDCNGNISGFTVTDQSGKIYNFDKAERTDVGYPSRLGLDDPNIYQSSWHLSSITSQQSNKIVNFVYSGESNEPGDQMINQVEVETVSYNNNSFAALEGSSTNTDHTSVTHFVQYLEEISWDGGTIEFLTTSGRFDREAGIGRILDQVVIRNDLGELIKSYKFRYNPGTNVNVQSSTPEKNHLILHSISEVGKNGTEKPPYAFEYYNVSDLPDRDSFSKDHDGYFNEQNNSTLIPTYRNFMLNIVPRADRTPTAQASITGMLHEITYPTGGSTQFEYENHEYYNGFQALEAGEVVTAETCVNGIINPVLGIQGLTCVNTEVKTITIPTSAHNIKFVVQSLYDHSNTPTVNSGNYFIKIKEGSSVIYEWNSLASDANSSLLQPGNTYTIEAYTSNDYTQFSLDLRYNHTINVPNNEILGGLRVARITDILPGSNGTENNVRVKEYDYEIFEGSNIGTPSGLVLTNPEPSYLKESRKYTGGSYPTNFAYFQHGSSPGGAYELFGGGQVVYLQVTERYPGNGYTRYKYLHSPDQYDANLMELPINIVNYPQSTNMSSTAWKRGLLQKQATYNENGDIVQSIENQYTFPVIDSTYSFKYDILYDDQFGPLSTYTWSLDKQRSGWVKQLSQITKSYEGGSESTVESNTYYDSGSPTFVLPIRRDYLLDGLNDYYQTFSYLDDRINHIINPLTEISRYDPQDLLLEENAYSYHDGKVELIEKYIKGSTSPDYTTLLSHYKGLKASYIEDPSGVNIVYLWGYGGTLPVAKITNANYTNIENILGSSLSAIEDSYNNSFIRSQLLSLQSNLNNLQQMSIYLYEQGVGVTEEISPNGLVTTYHYDEFNRLYQIKDQNANVLKEYHYNYSN